MRSWRRFLCIGLACAFCFTATFPIYAAGKKESQKTTTTSATSQNQKLFEWTGNKDYISPKNQTVAPSNLENQLEGLSADWYRDASFYHIWIKSFNDYDGDGIGDFRGITAKLDYIKNEVGCDAIWLSPLFDCHGKGSTADYNMHGYDTTNYYDVNDYFGNMEHLEQLLEEAHKRDIKVIFDFVPNHTSNNHVWFLQSAKREDGKEDWYLWNTEKLSWNAMGNGNTWHTNFDRGQYFYGAFSPSMPDLNYRNYEVREEMKNVVRFWLNKGFDGVRVDAVRYLLEDSGVQSGLVDITGTHDFFEELRREVIDEYVQLGYPKFMVAEAWITNDRNRLNRYSGSAESPEFNMLFDFDFTGKVTAAVRFANPDFSRYVQKDLVGSAGSSGSDSAGSAAQPRSYGIFLSNHDNVANRPGSVFRIQNELYQATAISLLLPQTPFVYYGNEIGQEDQPGLTGHDIRLRYPLNWSEVATQIDSDDSLLALHKTLLGLRSKHLALRRGAYSELSTNTQKVFAYSLRAEDSEIVCVFNLGSSDHDVLEVELTDFAGSSESVSLAGSEQAQSADSAGSAGLAGSAVALFIRGLGAHKIQDGTLVLQNVENHGFAVFEIKRKK